MKVLWISVAPIGPAGRILDMKNPGTSGGWIQSTYDLLKEDHIEVVFACSSKSVKSGTFIRKERNGQTAYCFNLPKISYGRAPVKKDLLLWERMVREVNPDIIHIWGTENVTQYTGSLLAPEIPKVLFVQGILGIHQRYSGLQPAFRYEKNYYSFLSRMKLSKKKLTSRYFHRQVLHEKEIYRRCKNIIVDNEFSRAYGNSIDHGFAYLDYSLPINQAILDSKWNQETCNPKTIFTVYSGGSMKGLHQLLKALVIVKKKYPDIRLLVPGNYSFGKGRIRFSRGMSPYENWVANFIKSNDLMENVEFLGKLDADGMRNNYNLASIFVNPSCMENHAGSLREAMSTGMPCITTLAGSVLEFVRHGENGLVYRFEEYEELAYHIETLIGNSPYALKLGMKAKETISKKYSHVSIGSLYEKVLEDFRER